MKLKNSDKKCQATIFGISAFDHYTCGNPAKYYEDGKYWCGHHAPSVKKKRAEKKQEAKERKANKIESIRWKISACKSQIKFSENSLAEARKKLAELYPGEPEIKE